MTEADHWLACLPLAHVGGLSVVTRALHTGTDLTVLPRFDVAPVEAAARGGATLVSLVATALGRIDASLFRTIVLGGAAPPPDRPANTVTTYGMTETGSGVVYDGVPLDGVDVRIDDDGEIHLRGPMLLRAYRDGRDPLIDGWLMTGDVGRWLPDGRLHVDGRRGDLIITGGENVWPEAVERALRTDPRVGDVAVSGTPRSGMGPDRDRVRRPQRRRRAVARRPRARGEGVAARLLRPARAVRGGRDPPHRARQASPRRVAALSVAGAQHAITFAIAAQNSDQRSSATLPATARRRSTGTSCTLSRLATDPARTPSTSPIGTSVGIVRTVVVIGAKSTGRTLSRSAHQTWP